MYIKHQRQHMCWVLAVQAFVIRGLRVARAFGSCWDKHSPVNGQRRQQNRNDTRQQFHRDNRHKFTPTHCAGRVQIHLLWESGESLPQNPRRAVPLTTPMASPCSVPVPRVSPAERSVPRSVLGTKEHRATRPIGVLQCARHVDGVADGTTCLCSSATTRKSSTSRTKGRWQPVTPQPHDGEGDRGSAAQGRKAAPQHCRVARGCSRGAHDSRRRHIPGWCLVRQRE